ncbi:hypothetical protein SMD44_07290 [Streptomyces alboflavus]|uniref:Uncharacterized protein n=1 Tax=Streptomyces alboflavus TaxID=67267 RepID=A0A1Z1WN35_9ACTN|nr:hypothetical protein SMD44_07290 [Streptomyces alboflavus]
MLDADAVDVLARCHAGLRVEGAGEVPGREPGALREGLHAQVSPGMLGDPLLDLAQRLTAGRLRRQLGAELRLVAGAAQEHDEVARDGQRRVPAQVLLDEGERQVDARRDARRGRHVPVPYVDGVGVHVDLRVVPGECVAVRPVGRRATAVEQAGAGEQDGPGADRDQPLGERCVGPQPGDQGLVLVPGARAARHQDGVRHRGAGPSRVLGERGVRDQREPARRPHGGAVEGGGAHLVRRGVGVGVARSREHLGGARDVEALDAVEEDDQDGSLLHAHDS